MISDHYIIYQNRNFPTVIVNFLGIKLKFWQSSHMSLKQNEGLIGAVQFTVLEVLLSVLAMRRGIKRF